MDNEHHPLQHRALMVRSRNASLIWIVPAITVIIAIGLAWHSYSNHGLHITIRLDSAAGIEPGITKIKHKDSDVGFVESVHTTDDLSHVIVTARMAKVTEPYLTKKARFWLVKPNISKDLSSIGSLISGPYIEFEPSAQTPESNKPSRNFIAEQTPMVAEPDAPGEIYTIHAKQLGSIGQGTPVFFHGIQVGKVLGYELSDKDGSADIRLLVYAPHNTLVHTGTRFWNTSGVSVVVGNGGLRIQLDSVQSVLTGGIAFDVPSGGEEGGVANSDTPFTLYSDEASAQDAVYTQRVYFLLRFTQNLPGLAAGSPVRMQGIVIGQVSDVHIEYDSTSGKLAIPVTIEVEVDRLKFLHDHTSSKMQEANADAVFHKLIAAGLRAHLGSGNLITGQKVIDLDLMPDAPPATIIAGEIPTTGADDLDSVMHSAKATLTTLQGTLQHANSAISSDNNGGDLAGTLQEIKGAARSTRVLTDYLETHPEALISGKPEGAAP